MQKDEKLVPGSGRNNNPGVEWSPQPKAVVQLAILVEVIPFEGCVTNTGSISDIDIKLHIPVFRPRSPNKFFDGRLRFCNLYGC